MELSIMKNFLFLLSFGFLAFSCDTKKENTEATSSSEVVTAMVTNLEPKVFQEKSVNGILLDVRTPEEVAAGKIPGSISIDFYQEDFATKVKELPKDKEIYVYCAVGARSGQAADLLIQQGFTKVYHLSGGIRAWTSEGLPITQE
jgi:rhodanese-related sulfurtransferase